MDISDLWRILLQWVHLLAAVAWVGGSLFFWLVWRPVARGAAGKPGQPPEAAVMPPRAFETAIRREFRDVVKIAVAALAITGGVLTFDRLAGAGASPLYGAVLGLKIAAAVAMIWLIGLLRPRRSGTQQNGRGVRRAPELVLILGGTTFLLAILLRVIRTTGNG
ncbi:MAG: hypothetical protein CL878_12615 [Dehalococcoidia bacterium]|nr:hypothetical protein [Dehalococcoidia bacterium]